MPNELNAVEQAVVRGLRESLERLQSQSEELHHAVADVVAACSSNKPTNALPPLLRAQTSAASLAAALEVLSRFIAATLRPGVGAAFEAEVSRLAAVAVEAPPVALASVQAIVAEPQAATAAPP